MSYITHQCSAIPAGIRIERCSDDSVIAAPWILVVAREATEADLEENHYLENVGDEIWSTEVQITCCPYCGEQLGLINEHEPMFMHFDSSGWMPSHRVKNPRG